jgi:hypothetical protein
MANLVSPDTASSKTQEPPAPMPKPKEEPEKENCRGQVFSKRQRLLKHRIPPLKE